MNDQNARSQTTADWRPLSELPNGPAMHVIIRTPKNAGTTWRWLPYKKGAQWPWIGGRWQIATEYGFRNELLPKEGEWRISR